MNFNKLEEFEESPLESLDSPEEASLFYQTKETSPSIPVRLQRKTEVNVVQKKHIENIQQALLKKTA